MSIITKNLHSLEYLVAEGISVPHCFTTRYGGVSTGTQASLNLAFGRGDTMENVKKISTFWVLPWALIRKD